MPVIPAQGKLRQEHCCKLKSSLGPETQRGGCSPSGLPSASLTAGIEVLPLTEHVAVVLFPDSCIYKKVCPFNGGSFLLQPSASDFQFCWNQAPYAIGKSNLFCGPCPCLTTRRARSPVSCLDSLRNCHTSWGMNILQISAVG